MIYSCFNERLGQYEYFSDNKGHAVNGDLPVPKLARKAGETGVPARETGRPLPGDAQRIGSGWHAQGIIVQCEGTQIPGLSGDADDLGSSRAFYLVLAAGGAALLGYYLMVRR